MKEINNRKSDYPIHDIFLERHSPRAFSGEAVSKDELMTLFEAARWAPSASNEQSWRFIYAMTGTPEFEQFLSFLTAGNQEWCVRAGALVVVLSKKITKLGEESKTHSLEAGLATENMLLQATSMNLYIHPMGGILPELIQEKLNIPDEYKIEIMIAIGRPGNVADLSEKNQARENPSDRKPLEEIVFEGKYRENL